VLRAPGETETTQDNIQHWLQLDEGDPGFQLLTEQEIAAVIIFLFSTYLFSKFIFVLPGYFCFITQDFRLIRMTSPRN
jgi:hypothetical protein